MYHFLESRNKLHLVFSSLLLFLLFPSCEEILSIKVPEHLPLVTVNCILDVGQPIRMEINSSKPYPPLIDSSLTIKDATVKLFEDDVYIEDLVYQESYQYQNEFSNYRSLNGFTPGLNHTYSINVTAPGFSEVTSKTSIPQNVPVISIDTNTVFIRFGGYTVKTLECTIKYKDPPGIKNFYKLVINRAGRYTKCNYLGRDCKTVTTGYGVPFFSYDPNALYFKKSPNSPGSIDLEEENNELWVYEIFLADDSFDGMTYELKVLIPPLMDFANQPVPSEKFTLRKINFRLYSINEEYYKYAGSYFTQVYKKNDMFSEPCQGYSNIDNGMGIFSGSSLSIDSSVVMPVYYVQIFD